MTPLFGLLVATLPALGIDPELAPAEPIAQATAEHWAALEAATPGLVVPAGFALQLMRTRGLAPHESGRSVLGRIYLRQNRDQTLTPQFWFALRHELAHQRLLAGCPAASRDALFHEAFAIATSGERSAFEGPYLSLPAAQRILDADLRAEGTQSRRAIARLLAEHGPSGLPRVLLRRLAACRVAAPWRELTPAELAGSDYAAADTLVVLSRFSGERIRAEGPWQQPMPVGSTLKPFLYAAGREPGPVLRPERGDPAWAGCDDQETITPARALLLSCNGYFLRAAAATFRFGVFAPLFEALSAGTPADAADAIGLRPTLQLSADGMAQAYRLLAAERPDVLRVLRQNARRGTLAGLASSATLSSAATKTGTVRDADSAPILGWIVAVDGRYIIVRTRRDQAPRAFAGEVAALLKELRARPGDEPVAVQTFGLVDAAAVELECRGLGFAGTVRFMGPRNLRAMDRPLICLGGVFAVRVQGGPPRVYAGTFHHDPAPAGRAAPSIKAARARRGSDTIFRTTRARYVAGVLAAEDAAIRGPAREALLRVIDHNAQSPRHLGRPICDTTHCQAFRGTETLSDPERALLSHPIPGAAWLRFSLGGDEPWNRTLPVSRVEHVLGPNPAQIRFAAGRARWRYTRKSGAAIFDEPMDVPCDVVRGALSLPSCPERVRRAGAGYLFSGRGAGHGEGLDLEAAKRATTSASRLLEAAYGSVDSE